ncbi:hypothetical protein [Nocardia salmonicida]|uniref:hypothetical protein n=1 Tax=Nocardia salmonicida TaxID=53431 RepID=UPI003CF418BC
MSSDRAKKQARRRHRQAKNAARTSPRFDGADDLIDNLMPMLRHDPTPIFDTETPVPTDNSPLSPWEPATRLSNVEELDYALVDVMPPRPAIPYGRLLPTIVDLTHGLLALTRVRAASAQKDWAQGREAESALDRDLHAELIRWVPTITAVLDETAVRPMLTLTLPADLGVRDYDHWVDLWYRIGSGLRAAAELARAAAQPDAPIPHEHRFLAGSLMLTLSHLDERYFAQYRANMDALNADMDAFYADME